MRKKSKGIIAILVFLLVGICFQLYPKARKTLRTVFIDQKVKIDGKLEEAFYKRLTPAGDFIQFHPENGKKPSAETRVYCFYDKKNIYFAFKCYDDNPGQIAADVTAFGEFSRNDEVTVFLDTFNDKMTYEVFKVNPRGIMDGKKTVWDGDARITPYGWSAEIKIPFKSLRFPVRDQQHWSANFRRKIFRNNETLYWTKVERNQRGVLGDTFADLEGLKGIKGGKNIEVFPYAGFRSSRAPGEKDEKFAYGVDLKYGITSNLTLDLTSSPDYSEVESDPFFYQLSPHEFYLGENRPFYLESRSYFSTPLRLFYSRRIGNPTLAAKVTGKEKGFTIGALAARNSTDGNESFHGVFRLKKDIFRLSTIGMIYSSIEDGDTWNRNIGVDFRFKFKNIYTITGMVAKSFNHDRPNNGNGLYRLIFLRAPDKGFTLAAVYLRMEPNVYVPAGFISKVDYQRLLSIWRYTWRWENKWLETLTFRFWKTNENSISSNLKVEDTYQLNMALETRSRFTLSLSTFAGKIRARVLDPNDDLVWENKLYPTRFQEINLRYNGSRKLSFRFNTIFIQDFVYNDDFTDTRAGRFVESSLGAGFKISPQLQWNLTLSRTAYHSLDRGIDFKGNLISTSVNFQADKKLASYIKFQYDSYLERFQYDFLVAYEMTNLNKIYLSIKSYSERQFRLFHPEARSVGFKVSYLLRI
ncbi:MAG: carbohydrate binding family 9 domain-containing protein [bacterium]|nr:carbohydrate binding family 9 domain-containing protein [bacterium]